MQVRRFALIDPAAGISGDMLLGALIDAGAPPGWLRGLPARLGLDKVTIEIADVMRRGMRSTKVDVRLDGAIEEPSSVILDDHEPQEPAPEHPHHHHHHGSDTGSGHDHHHGGHPHRHVGELLRMIAAADLSPTVKERATRAFQLLAEAEGKIHGVPADDVGLHEVGAFDALIDIVGGVEGFEQLGVDAIYARPVAVGSGWVRTSHGVLPVPTPATAGLLEGLAIAPNGPVKGEATTPTGATLLRSLVTGPMPEGVWQPVKTGYGAGGRDPSGYPNTLRIVVGEFVESDLETLVVVATDLDDFNPEYLEPLRDGLTAAGALDVQCWSTQMKKGRLGLRVEALAPTDRSEAVVNAFFRHSTTAGVRRWTVTRAALPREQWIFTSPAGDPIRVKTLHGPDGPRVKPEYDDVVAVSRRTGQPAHELSRTIQEEALRAVRATEPAPGAVLANPKESPR